MEFNWLYISLEWTLITNDMRDEMKPFAENVSHYTNSSVVIRYYRKNPINMGSLGKRVRGREGAVVEADIIGIALIKK